MRKALIFIYSYVQATSPTVRNSTLNRLQSLYTECVRRAVTASYVERKEQIPNIAIKRTTSTPTPNSLVYTRYVRQIYKWEATLPSGHVNKAEINNAFNGFDR